MREDGGWAPNPARLLGLRYQAAEQSGRPCGRSFLASGQWGFAFFPLPRSLGQQGPPWSCSLGVGRGEETIVCCMNSRLGSLGNKFAAQRASLQLGREWEVLTGWPHWGIIWFWHECLTDCLGPDGKGGKSCSKKVVSKTELLRALI